MTSMSGRDASWRAVHDPSTSADELAAIAAAHPEFAAAIAAHPNAYDGLRVWASGITADASPEPVEPAPLAEPEPEPEPEPLAEPAQDGGAPPPHSAGRVWWRRKSVLVPAAGALVVVGAAVAFGIGALVQQAQWKDAAESFETASQRLTSAVGAVEAVAEEAGALLTRTPADLVADPATIEGLAALADEAALVDDSIPARGDTTERVREQIQDLDDRAYELEILANDLGYGIDDVEASVHDRTLQLVTANASYSIVATDGNGNQERITVRIGSWVRGDDTALLDEAWASIGGEGSMPLLGDADGFTAADGAFVFGTVGIENTTPDFPAENFGNGNSWVSLTPLIEFDGFFTDWHDPSFEGLGATMQARQYSSGVSSDPVGGQNPLIKADMSSGNVWGNAPFVIGVDTVFSPNFPEGNPKLDEIHFSLRPAVFIDVTGDTSFQIGRSW